MMGLSTYHPDSSNRFNSPVYSPVNSRVKALPPSSLARSRRPPPWRTTVLPPKPRTLDRRAAAQSSSMAQLSDASAFQGFVPRCSEKGCVFPQAQSGCGKCRQHERQSSEPDLFASRQPSVLLLDRAKFGVADSEMDDQGSRASDRRNIAKLWQSFQESV